MAKDREGVASGVLLTCMVKSWAAPTTAWPHPPGSARPLPSGHCPAELPWVLGSPQFGRPQGDHAPPGHQEGNDAKMVLVRCDPPSATRSAQNPAHQAMCRRCGLQASRPLLSREGSSCGASTEKLAAAPARDAPG